MNESGLKWGIIGCGGIADAEIAPAIKNTANAELIAVLSRNQEKALAFAEKHGSRKAYHDIDAFLSDPEIEVVYIGTPPYLHCEQAIAVAQSGKHILCDKPMAMNSVECKQMIEVCQKHSVKLMVGFMMRFNAYNLKIHEAMGSLRVIGTCFAIGEAAGAAASLSLQAKVTPNMLNVKKLQKQLGESGVPF